MKPLLTALLAILTSVTTLWAADPEPFDASSLPTDSIEVTNRIITPFSQSRRAPAPDPFAVDGALGHFTWGVDLGTAIDLSAHDMTMWEISACFGYKNRWVRFVGIGASIESMVNNSSRCYPIYGMLRTSFSPNFRFCFLDARCGISVNNILNYKAQTDLYASLGIGFTLAHSRKFSSHIILKGIYMPLKPVMSDGEKVINYQLGYASVGIGCAF